MPEARLARTRQTLPAVYQFGDAGFTPDGWFDAPCRIRNVEPGHAWNFFCDTHYEPATATVCLAVGYRHREQQARVATWKSAGRG